MLDLIIAYVNFLILSVSYIVKKFTFFPPDPPHYISIKTENEDEEDILFLIQQKKKQGKYIGIEFRLLEYRFIKIIDKNNNSLPLLLFHPPSHIPVCIIYSHGNSGDLGSCLIEYYDIAIHTNCIVVSFEYPGYGECKNQDVKESEFFQNLKMTYYFVKKILGFKPSQIILYGFSLGTGIMFDLACKKEFHAAGLILQSPFLSIMRTLYNIKTTPYCDLFNSCDKAKNLCIKTFFIHGNKDEMVPYIHGRILAKLIPQKYFYDFLTVDNAGHNNIFKVNKDLIYTKIRQFIKDCTGKSSDFTIKKEIKEKDPLKDFEDNLKKEKSSNKKTESVETKEPNKNDEQKKNTSNLREIKKYPLINMSSSTNVELNSLVNYNLNQNVSLNSIYNQEFYFPNNNNNNYKSSISNSHRKKFPSYFSNYNTKIFRQKLNNINYFPGIGIIKGNILNNYIFNANNIQNYSRNNLNNASSYNALNTEQNLINSYSMNKLNSS